MHWLADPALQRPTRTRTSRRWLVPSLLALLAAACFAAPSSAQELADADLEDLAELTIEQLSQIKVSSVARREQRLSETPASVFVITRDMIRRSGAITLPEVLRLAPNLQVART